MKLFTTVQTNPERARLKFQGETVNSSECGYTVIELMVVVAIVGILSAIAIPQYREHVREGCRTDFMAALEKVANEQEQFYYDRNTFSGFIASLPVSPNSERGHYAITTSLVGGDTDTYRALAVPLNGDCLSASDRRYRLDHTGRKEHKDTSGNWTLGWDY